MNTIIIDNIEYTLTPVELKQPKTAQPKNKVRYELEHPKNEQKYWYVGTSGQVWDCTWNGDRVDIDRFNFNNVFLSEENAQKEADIKKLKAEIRRFADTHNDYINWNNEKTEKFCFCYLPLKKDWLKTSSVTFQDIGTIYFSSSEIRDKAFDLFKNRLNILID